MSLTLFGADLDDSLNKEVKESFEDGCRIRVLTHPSGWAHDKTAYAYDVWIEYGSELEDTMMFNVKLDELEMFTNSLLKSIEMLRRDYGDVLKDKIKNHHNI